MKTLFFSFAQGTNIKNITTHNITENTLDKLLLQGIVNTITHGYNQYRSVASS